LVLQLAKMTSLEDQVVQLINKERKQRGLKPLHFDPELNKWARIKTEDMIKNGYFAHKAPKYGKAVEMLRKAGLTFRWVGENLGKTSSVQRAHQGFMNSKVHKATLLNKDFTHAGGGIVYKGATLFITQLFAAK